MVQRWPLLLLQAPKVHNRTQVRRQWRPHHEVSSFYAQPKNVVHKSLQQCVFIILFFLQNTFISFFHKKHLETRNINETKTEKRISGAQRKEK